MTRRSENTVCPVCEKPALSVKQVGHKTLVYCHYSQCDRLEILKALGTEQPQKESFSTLKAQPSETSQKHQWVERLWNESRPAQGTVIETYLKSRGLSGKTPPSIRFLPQALHTPTQARWPVMLTAVKTSEGALCGIHRTFLDPQGRGKAPITPNKMSLGVLQGAAAQLFPVGPQGHLLIAEGIENALTLYEATGKPVWAGLSAGGLMQMVLPDCIKSITLCPDYDSVGLKAAEVAAYRWVAKGRSVFVAKPLLNGKDWNEVLTHAT
jgi:hypothetical protein